MYTIYTDGGCTNDRGSWAAIINEQEISGVVPFTTSNRMELFAAIKALSGVPAGSEVALYADSKYLINGLNAWIDSWKKLNWKRADGTLKNVDLWQELDALKNRLVIKATWIPREQNSRADFLSGQARDSFWPKSSQVINNKKLKFPPKKKRQRKKRYWK